jgi:alpha-tubulin suppressor-like RCC1 family protein
MIAMRWSLVFAALLACGDQVKDPPCSIRCDEGCPTGTTCSVGFCALDGTTCEPRFERAFAGAGFACALDQFHRAWCWGANADHQIDGSERATIDRAIVAGDRRWDSITVGGGHACALDGNELWCWGRNDRNQVTGSIVGPVAAPIRIEVDGNTVDWTAASAGYDYTCAIGSGDIYCWGAGDVGKLGGGTVNDAPRPQRIASNIHDWFDVSAGSRHTCALSRDSGVWCWGDGSAGQLGNDRFNVRLEPQAVALDAAIDIAVGLETTCAITPDHQLLCWGRAFHGALGDPDVVDPGGPNAATPVAASSLAGWVEVSAAQRYACGRLETGDVHCWGTSRAGGFGTGLWQRTRAFDKVLVGATSIAVGWNGTDADPGRDEGDLDLACAIVDGDVRCWGDNRFGQLSQGGVTHSETPVAIGGDHRWSSLAAGAAHVCGSEADSDDVYCWGSVELGQVAGIAAGRTTPCTDTTCDVALPRRIDTGLTGPHALAAGANHACMHSGLAIACWGDSRLGQAGAIADGALAPSLVPGQFVELFAGANATCAIDSTQQTICWGKTLASHGPEPVPELAGTDLQFGIEFGCGLDDQQTLVCFGDHEGGAFGVGAPGTCGDNICNNDETAATCADCGTPPITTTGRVYQALAIGRRSFACGIRTDGRIECWGDNSDGQCGTLDNAVVTIPNMIADAADCTQISAGRNHACALCGATPNIVCWGDARHGEVGAPAGFDPVITARAIAPPAGSPWASVTAGDGFTCGTTADGTAYCWGTSLHGALGTGGRGANLPTTIQLGAPGG